MVEWDPDYVPGVKLGLHSLQIVLSFAAWCLEIAVFVGKDAKIVGNNAWTFSVVRIRGLDADARLPLADPARSASCPSRPGSTSS